MDKNISVFIFIIIVMGIWLGYQYKSYNQLQDEFYNYRTEVHEILKDNAELTNKLKQYEQDVYENKIDNYDSFINSRGY